MKPRFYITGANGFIGRHVCEYLKGEDVYKIDHKKIGIVTNPNQERIVVHLAAYGNHSEQTSHKEIIKANINLLETLVSFFANEGVTKFYNVSTSSVALPKQTMYSASKLFGETLIESLNDERFVNVRPYSVYGPGEADHRFIPTVIRCLKSGEKMNLDPHATHDWIYVEDFIKAMFAGYTSIGTGIKTTNLEVVKMLEAISGKKLNYEETKLRDYDNGHWVSPVTVPHRTLFDGLKLTYDSYK